MELIDTHCHIQSAGLTEGEKVTRELWGKVPERTQGAIIESAKLADVRKMIAVGCTLEDSELAIACARRNPAAVWASIGIHPHEAKDYQSKAKKTQFAHLLTGKKDANTAKTPVVAIGECGLDYFYGLSPKEDQCNVLEFQLDLAQKHDLPLIFHVREAFDDFWPILSQFKGVRGVLHSYTDNIANLEKAVRSGLYVGVNGIATFAKTDAQRAMYRAIPGANLLLETDAPFLTPVPHRGTINEPKYVAVTAEFLAELRGENLEDIARTTTKNAQKLFGI